MGDEPNWLPRGRGRYDLTVGYTVPHEEKLLATWQGIPWMWVEVNTITWNTLVHYPPLPYPGSFTRSGCHYNEFPTLPNKTILKCYQFSSINILLVLILGETSFGSSHNRTIIVYGNGRATNNEAIIRERYRLGRLWVDTKWGWHWMDFRVWDLRNCNYGMSSLHSWITSNSTFHTYHK